MKNLLLLIALSFGLVVSISYANDKEPNEDELLRKSQLTEPAIFNSGSTSFPRNFTPTTAWSTPLNAAVSTGYYWIDDREALDPELFPDMRPSPSKIDTGMESQLWRKILPGPRILPKSFWENNKQEGYPFFRQPADGLNENVFWDNPVDSTDEAIAGPIPLGIQGGFYFNGIRYDSFYVSTNGLIALTNRRYFYDSTGKRVIPPGAVSAYDPMSMDWFVGTIRGRDTSFVRNWNDTQDSITPTFQKIPIKDENGNQVYKNGLTDPVPDNFGYLYSVLGSDPQSMTFDRTITTSGIRARGGDLLTTINQNSKSALIAVFWGDLMLSQFNPKTLYREEHGKVWYKRNAAKDSLIIAYFNAQPKGDLVAALNATGGPVTTTVDIDRRPGDASYATADAHVVLSSKDSSITIHYTRITDSVEYVDPVTAITVKASARELFRYNTTAGVRGFARHKNYGKGGIANGDLFAGEYVQATSYWDRYRSDTANPEVMYPTSMSAVKFKQWKNTLRVQSLSYRVRSRTPGIPNPTAYVTTLTAAEMDDYELLAGHDRLGQIQPFAIVQNLSNEIQGPDGVNFMKQDHTFRMRFLVRNSVTGRAIYNRVVPVNANCLGLPDNQGVDCNGDQTVKVRLVRGTTIMTDAFFLGSGFNGVPAYYGAEVQFPPFEPNQFIDEHIGKMRAMAIAEPIFPADNRVYEDHWPFDDTLKTTMFVMRRFYDQNPDPRFRVFDDDVNEWFVDVENGKNIPSVWKWVNINAEVVAGNQVSKYPTPPRGLAIARNYELGGIPQPIYLESPTIRMNRLQIDGRSEFLSKFGDTRSPQRGGDEIRSYPIDLRGKKGSVLTLSIQRTIHREDWVRGYNDRLLVGPEPRVVMNGNVLNPYIQANTVSQYPDELVVEFARPSDDEINGITNIPLANWRHHPGRRGTNSPTITNNAALTLYGAGGYLIGFLENDKDSALALPGTMASGLLNSLRANLYDDGIDIEFKKFAIQIPDTFINWKNNGAKHFRFRVKVYAINNRKCATCIVDDADDFFVDNIKLLYKSEITDLEVTSVKVNWPYTLAPASQATFVPISVTISNNTNLNAANFAVRLKIHRIDANGNHIDDPEKPIYCRIQTISNLTPSGTIDLTMPAWNARKSQIDTVAHYRLVANIINGEPDLIPKNDTTFSDFTLRFSDQFAYDPPVDKPRNDVDDFIIPAGKGLNFHVPLIEIPNPIPGLPPISMDMPRSGSGQLTGTTYANWSPILDVVGVVGGSGSGAVAVKFNLLNSDTLRGVRIFWANLSQSATQISIKIMEGNESLPNDSKVKLTMVTRRGGPNFANVYNQYVDYPFDEPLILARGMYWVSVAQDGEAGFELGLSKSRTGMRTTNVTQESVAPNWWGMQGITLNLDKNFRRMVDGNLVNNNFFAFQNIIGIGTWIPFTPEIGNVGLGHNDHTGFMPGIDNTTRTLTRGTWIPHIRPIFGYKPYGEAVDEWVFCDDVIPVELYTFTGNVRTAGIDLYWETASEVNNYGFYVERRLANKNEEFKQIGFVSGVGNATTISRYNFLDKDVTPKTTYEYRLRQMDRDGAQDCFTSNIVTLTYDRVGELTLEPNSPNPFTNNTNINFNLPSAQNVKLEIVDLFGNVVKVIENNYLSARNYSYSFDGNDENGNPLPTGTYIYRLNTDKESLSGKMSIVR